MPKPRDGSYYADLEEHELLYHSSEIARHWCIDEWKKVSNYWSHEDGPATADALIKHFIGNVSHEDLSPRAPRCKKELESLLLKVSFPAVAGVPTMNELKRIAAIASVCGKSHPWVLYRRLLERQANAMPKPKHGCKTGQYHA